jgi:hypothetical protein
MARFELLDPEMSTAGSAYAIASGDILFEMGLRCATGRNGRVDLVSAHMYFNLADRNGAEDAAFHRQEIAAQMSKSDVSRALRAARDWLTIH